MKTEDHKNYIDMEVDFEQVNPSEIAQKQTDSLSFISKLVDNVKGGYVNPLEAFVSIKELEKAFTKAKKEIEELATREAEKYGTNFNYFDYQVTLKNGGKIFDYKGIPEVDELEAKLKQTKTKYRVAFEGIETGNTILNDEGFVSAQGEVLPLPNIKYRKSSITVIKKQ